MNHVYASKIDISNFRAFGPNFSLSIPPGPGLVIVYGMNGLGKTTFFEAIEWLLTGDVRRIDDAKESRSPLAKHLTRRGAEPKSHFVAATFGPDEKRISRSETENPSASELIDLLVSSEWTPKPDDISTYLRLTMFLPQARKFRFEEEKPKDQWQLLRGPAGVDQLDVMRRALGGLPTKNAFDKVADDLRAKVLVQKRALDDWKELLEKRAQLANRITDTQTVSPEQAESFLSDLQEQLVSLGIRAIAEREETQGWTPERKLSTTVQGLDTTTDDLSNEIATLKGFTELINEWIAVSSELESDVAKVEDTTKQVDATSTKVADAKDAFGKLLLSLQERQREVTQLKEQREAAEKASGAFTRLEESLKAHGALLQDQKTLQASVQKLRLAITETAKVDQRRKTLSEELVRQTTGQEKLNALIKRVVAFDAASEKAKDTDTKLDKLKDEQVNSIKLVEELKSKIEQCNNESKRLKQQKDDVLAEAETMTRAIKIVCDHIAQDQETCPVCQAKYKDGALLERAKRSVESAGIDTITIDQAIAKNKSAQAEHQEKLESLQQRISQLPLLINELIRQQTARTQESTEIKQELAARGGDSATARNELGLERESVTLQIEETRDVLSQLPSAESTRQQLDQSKAELTNLEDQITNNETSVEQFAIKIEQDQAIVQSFRSQIDQPEVDQSSTIQLLESLKSKESASIAQAELAKQTHDKAEADFAKLSAELRQQRTDLKTHQASLTSNQQRQNALRERWEKILEGLPDATAQQRAILDRETTLEAVRKLRQQCSQTAERLDAWRENNQSVALDSSIAKKLQENDDCSEAVLTAKLEGAITNTEAEIVRVEDVKDRATTLANDLQEKVDEFNDHALRPLATRIQRFHDVLSPFRYQIEWEAKTIRGSMELRQSVSNESGLETNSSTPQVELSDGQMAVQGLATLFAASTEYRWSRWPALLLDDPLQSSDLLHTSAFIDILRGLITQLGYQVFLSSHDMEEAKYIIRKCERSGISVRKCHLLGPRSNGVEVATF